MAFGGLLSNPASYTIDIQVDSLYPKGRACVKSFMFWLRAIHILLIPPPSSGLHLIRNLSNFIQRWIIAPTSAFSPLEFLNGGAKFPPVFDAFLPRDLFDISLLLPAL
ncbi:MAG: hypothetical protein ACRD4S_14705 [Candidatus Acidiferrales bacterium]